MRVEFGEVTGGEEAAGKRTSGPLRPRALPSDLIVSTVSFMPSCQKKFHTEPNTILRKLLLCNVI